MTASPLELMVAIPPSFVKLLPPQPAPGPPFIENDARPLTRLTSSSVMTGPALSDATITSSGGGPNLGPSWGSGARMSGDGALTPIGLSMFLKASIRRLKASGSRALILPITLSPMVDLPVVSSTAPV